MSSAWSRCATPKAEPETYSLPLRLLTTPAAGAAESARGETLAEVVVEGRNGPGGFLREAIADAAVAEALVGAITRRRTLRGTAGEVIPSQGRVSRQLQSGPGQDAATAVRRPETGHGSVVFGNRFILRLIQRVPDGVSPELEVGQFLTERTRFRYMAPVAGALEYRRPRQANGTLGILLGFLPNEGDAWGYTLDEVRHFFERALLQRSRGTEFPLVAETALELARRDVPDLANALIGGYLENAVLLGRRTAELHLALASDAEDPAFAPEPFTSLYQRSLYQSMRNLTARSFHLLRDNLAGVPPDVAGEARRVAGAEDRVLQLFHGLTAHKVEARRIRCHGDYHLGHVLRAGREFFIIDCEGEPVGSSTDYRLKQSPLRDVASMLRSFDYAVHTVLYGPAGLGLIRTEEAPQLEPVAAFWRKWVSAAFLRGYLGSLEGANFMPTRPEHVDLLLRVLVLEKAVHELAYELLHRPEWVRVPVRAILALLRAQG